MSYRQTLQDETVRILKGVAPSDLMFNLGSLPEVQSGVLIR